jgi:hypothetical protein
MDRFKDELAELHSLNTQRGRRINPSREATIEAVHLQEKNELEAGFCLSSSFLTFVNKQMHPTCERAQLFRLSGSGTVS